MKPFTTLTSHMVAMPIENIDTDQIIPAQFLKTISKKGLGKNLFFHWRYEENGAPKADFPLNQPTAQGAQILLAGDNFGCGSSREHAPWSLMDFGFTAVISTSFADIFHNNSLKNGLLPIAVDEKTHQQLLSLVAEDPSTQVSVDLATQTVTLPDGRSVNFPIDNFSKTCLLNGLDQLGYLLKQTDAVADFEAAHPARVNTSG
jgi:3-isopropylmalate/(R)-2-methylmalate dehydratase small subunit